MQDPNNVLARAYDMVLNGSEIGGGSVRINSSEMQKAVFQLLNIDSRKSGRKIWPFADCDEIRLSATWWHCIWSG